MGESAHSRLHPLPASLNARSAGPAASSSTATLRRMSSLSKGWGAQRSATPETPARPGHPPFEEVRVLKEVLDVQKPPRAGRSLVDDRFHVHHPSSLDSLSRSSADGGDTAALQAFHLCIAQRSVRRHRVAFQPGGERRRIAFAAQSDCEPLTNVRAL
jgi:hypothetical protein